MQRRAVGASSSDDAPSRATSSGAAFSSSPAPSRTKWNDNRRMVGGSTRRRAPVLLILFLALLSTVFYGLGSRLQEDDLKTLVDLSALLSDRKEQRTKNKLRLDWTNLDLQSPISRRIQAHMENCSVPLANYLHRHKAGLGSDLHIWSQAVCNGMADGYRIRTEPKWEYNYDPACGERTNLSSMLCYFPESELRCPNDAQMIDKIQGKPIVAAWASLGLKKRSRCEEVVGNYTEYRPAAFEYLFSRLSPAVVKEAERQLSVVFPGGVVPENLITIHVRWGDKIMENQDSPLNRESARVPIDRYIGAIQEFAKSREGDDVNVFLATEDPMAVKVFKDKAPNEWNIFVDAYFTETSSFRQDGFNNHRTVNEKLKGKPGLIALASLLVAMEANDFVLMNGSNWSRVMNYLRKNMVDPRCNGCTRMVDLNKEPWKSDW